MGAGYSLGQRVDLAVIEITFSTHTFQDLKESRTMRLLRSAILSLVAAGLATTTFAQQTGAIGGKVSATDGSLLPGVTVEARSDVMPGVRATTTSGDGTYRMPALLPGTYTLTFTLSGMQTVTRTARVQLAQETTVDAKLGVGLEEAVTVTAEASLIDKDTATIASGLSTEQISSLPVGQEYRDIQKLIPGVQYSQDAVRGPSAGGNGQDNVYQFDGVNVTLPLFGTLSADPATHDIAQVTVVKGGARAIDFDRSGGFNIDSVSKTGTSRLSGLVSFQYQNNAMAADLDSGSRSRYEQDRSWINASVGGPIAKDKLYFYASYYRPQFKRDNRANDYGELPDFDSHRNEGFGKLTWTPTTKLLLNVSYRDFKKTEVSDLFGQSSAPTTGTGGESRQKIVTFEGSWVISPQSFLTANFTKFGYETLGTPDFTANVTPTNVVGTRLTVPALLAPTVAGAAAFNTFVQPLIDRYGFLRNGVRTGGGIVGYGSEFNDQDFFRDALQIGYNHTVGRHDLHFGVELYRDSEELLRRSNGWGLISVPGGRVAAVNGQLPYYTARYQQQGTGQAAPINSDYESVSLEFNDMLKIGNWTLNLGVLASQDTLFGQGLREDAGSLSGYVAAPGRRYEMYKVPFKKMIQPRLGATWAYNDRDTVYASYAKYNPAASSLPRAASWDRNLTGTFIDAHFDQNGVLFAAVPVGSSSGKLFQPDMTPRTINEFLVGTARQLNSNLSARLYGRHRRGSHFWEDTNNNARVAFNPPAGIPRELYIPDLTARLAQIGSGSTYVIAELDGAYTRYNEVTLEMEWKGEKSFVRGSYTWSEYYGNFDQDNTTTGNDANIFIGSSFLADGAGRQLWDNKEGTLRGDRPHMLKVYGYRQLPWNAQFGVFAVAQSGQPWEMWSFEPYRSLTTNTSNTNRYAEPAGSRRSDAHFQIDFKYVHNFKLAERVTLQIDADLFNVFNKQTGYNINPEFNSATFGLPRNYFDPRRLQVAARLSF
jgi:hypothetical protein